MMQKKSLFGLVLAACLFTAPSYAAETIREFRGSGNTTTAEFTVDGPWLLDWRLDGNYAKSIALDISLIESPSGRFAGRVLYAKRLGNGVKLFENTGQYRLRISSTLANWTIKIQRIEPEEVELYVPKEPN